MKKLFKKLIGRRARRFYLWTAIILGSLIVLGYNVAKWRGAAAWKDAQARLEQENENVPLLDLLPEKVPDDENFFGTGALYGIARTGADMEAKLERLRRLATLGTNSGTIKKPNDRKTGGHYGLSRDFGPWVDYAVAAGAMPEGTIEKGDSAAAQFLVASDGVDPELIGELVAASERKYARFTPRLDALIDGKPMFEIPLPHLSPLIALSQAMGRRAAAAAQTGDGEKTLESLAVLRRLSEACGQEPLLISLLVSITADSLMRDATWEALDSGTLTGEDLQKLQDTMVKQDSRGTYLSAVRSEMLAALDIMDYLETNGSEALQIFSGISNDHRSDGGAMPGSLAQWLVPSGWIDQNRATYVNWSLDYVILPARDGKFPEMMEASEALFKELENARSSWLTYPHTIVPVTTMPVTSSIIRRVLEADARHALAVTSCALERFYLSKGNRYPDALTELVPDFIESVPIDPCDKNGKNIHYRTEGERYRLWSVGIDGEDDDGSTGEPEEDDPRSSNYEGDWVWRFGAS